MDTNKIKKFATEARTKLKIGIAAKIQSLGFDADGNVDERNKPEKIQGATIFNGQLYSEAFYNQWQSLYSRIHAIGLKSVYEEAAYTWFNRLVAIRILQKNGIGNAVLEFVDDARTPQIVDDARMGRYPSMLASDLQSLKNLILDDTKVTEQFAMLISAHCHNEPILYKCFGGIADYTELLIPNNILAEGGFIDLLNHTEFITDDDFKSPELIGWLYQFYIAERKAEVYESFDNGSKAESTEEIAAATQIFTPNWIVKYIVQNTVGRIYLDNNLENDTIKNTWRFLVKQNSPTPTGCKFEYDELCDLKIGDLACGSGHILNECFDLLFQLYVEEGYPRAKSIENIFRYNLVGIDLDSRAKQLATFALLLKACQKDINFADGHCLPLILDMPKPYNVEEEGPLSTLLNKFFQGTESKQIVDELEHCFDLIKSANVLGSLMKFKISESTRFALKQVVDYWEKKSYNLYATNNILLSFHLILSLTEKYSAIVMNPPYMKAGNMNRILNDYVKAEYKPYKTDLYSAFMGRAFELLDNNGKMSMVCMHSWMFNKAFEQLRLLVLNNYQIDNLLHLGTRTFVELGGEVVQNAAFTITNCPPSVQSIYFDLNKGDCNDKKKLFISDKVSPAVLFQNVFFNIPGQTFAYWISEKVFDIISTNTTLGEICEPRAGLQTSDNLRFLRLWCEVDFGKIGIGLSHNNAIKSEYKWFPHNKGGETRKWYGNRENVINFENDGQELKYWLEHNPKDPTTKSWSRNLRNYPLYFNEGLTWGGMSNVINVRYSPEGSTFDTSGPMLFSKDDLLYILGLTNSIVFKKFVAIFAQGLSKGSGHFAKVPFIKAKKNLIENLVKQNISISEKDWNAHETSWDFCKNELLSIDEATYFNNIDFLKQKHYKETGEHISVEPASPMFDDLEWCYEGYCLKWESLFEQLHDNEEYLNQQFIEIYGLQDELSPVVSTREITILQQGEITILDGENNNVATSVHFNSDVVMKQLISYIVGIWMGRYRLDIPGLYIAHQNSTSDDIAPYDYQGNIVRIDDDAIIPILPRECNFDDNLLNYVTDFIRIVFGSEKLTQNLNFIEKCLGTSIEKYLQKDFWKDHKKMYQNRPIYWLFSSSKGAFQALVYMHRMDDYTAATVRNRYLLKHIDFLHNQINSLEANAAALSTQQTRKLTNLRKDLEECLEYDERLQVYAEKPNPINLDDGVAVNYAKFGDILAKLK